MTKRAAEIVKYTTATHAAERMAPSKEALHLCAEIADGRISGDLAVQQILKRYGLERRGSHE